MVFFLNLKLYDVCYLPSQSNGWFFDILFIYEQMIYDNLIFSFILFKYKLQLVLLNSVIIYSYNQVLIQPLKVHYSISIIFVNNCRKLQKNVFFFLKLNDFLQLYLEEYFNFFQYSHFTKQNTKFLSKPLNAYIYFYIDPSFIQPIKLYLWICNLF